MTTKKDFKKELEERLEEKKKELLNESKHMAVQKIVKLLQSREFGMSKQGGNGHATAKNGKLIIKDTFWAGGEKKLNDMVREWTDPTKGSHYKYFKEEFGVVFRLVRKGHSISGGTIWGKKTDQGVAEIVLEVIDA